MATSRREFLKKGALVALAAGVPLSINRGVFGKEAYAPATEPILTKAAFKAQLNTQFRFNHGKSQVLVKLVEVSDLAHRKGAGQGKEGFSLIFRGPRAALKQNTYLIEHAKLGKFTFLIVPVVDKDKSAQSYEAVINRLYP